MVTANDIRVAIATLLDRYGETKVLPASSLYLELGGLAKDWASVDRAYQVVGGKVSGTDYPPDWVREHAEELADAINKEMA